MGKDISAYDDLKIFVLGFIWLECEIKWTPIASKFEKFYEWNGFKKY